MPGPAHLILFLLLCGLTPECDDLFDSAAFVSRDVDVYVEIRQATRLCATLNETPLKESLERTIQETALAKAWRKFAHDAGACERELFHSVLGREFVLILRKNAEGRHEWAALTEVDDASWTALHRRIRPRDMKPQWGLRIYRVPEHDLLLAHRGESVLLAPDPDSAPSLFYQTLPHLGNPDQSALNSDPLFAEARELGKGDIAVFKRHEKPLGGFSAAVIQFKGDAISIRHLSHFENSPFGEPYKSATISRPILHRFQSRQLMTIAQPFRAPSGMMAAFVRTQLSPEVLTERLRDNFGDGMLIVAGESGEHPGERAIHVAVAIELKSAEHALEDLDVLMESFPVALDRLRRESNEGEDDASPRQVISESGVRTMNLGPALRAVFYPQIKALDKLSVSWTVATGPTGHWWILSTSPQYLKSLEGQLSDPLDAPPEEENITGQIGRALPAAVAPHLKRLIGLLCHSDRRDVAGEFRTFSKVVCDFADDFETCEWRTETPGTNRIASWWTLNFREVRDYRGRNTEGHRGPQR